LFAFICVFFLINQYAGWTGFYGKTVDPLCLIHHTVLLFEDDIQFYIIQIFIQCMDDS